MMEADQVSRQDFYQPRIAWQWRAARWVVDRLRPELGWLVFTVALLLALLPALAFDQAQWINLSRAGINLDWLGPLAVLLFWLLYRGLRPLRTGSRRWLQGLGNGLLALGMGVGGLWALSQILVHWTPGPRTLWQAAVGDEWQALGQQVAEELFQLLLRVVWWWQGVQIGGAAQDDLIFAGISGLLFWLVGWSTAWLALRYRKGLLAALPSLWLVSLILYYSSEKRWLLVIGLILAAALHLWLDQRHLFQRWEREGTDYNPSLLADRALSAVGIGVIILALVSFTPNLYIRPLVLRAYDAMSPLYDRTESFGKRLFPDLERSFRGGRGAVSGGLPNSFLLGSGPRLSTLEVMRVRTNVAETEPMGSYLRGATYSVYDGRGWQNPSNLSRRRTDANQSWQDASGQGRRLLLQSVRLTFNANILYAAAEPLEPSIDYSVELRGPDDLVALWASTRGYTVLSAVPAVDEAMLAAAPGWEEGRSLPQSMQGHLALPDTVTERVRQLAAELTAGLDSPFARAQAIETYLRRYEYDLDVPEPPAEVTDVADFFLFDLRRGYCDYYATAFVVLARLSGLPTRFATGYVWGSWDEYEHAWVVTEAEAHSWPEVYFPDYGWIPFEPTGGRPALQRVALASLGASAGRPMEEQADLSGSKLIWDWQMLVWLLPLGVLSWFAASAVLRRRRRRENPWRALLRWGQRLGCPAQPDETELEYGVELADHLGRHMRGDPEHVRRAARTVVDISQDVCVARYGPMVSRQSAWDRARVRWQGMRR